MLKQIVVGAPFERLMYSMGDFWQLFCDRYEPVSCLLSAAEAIVWFNTRIIVNSTHR